MNRPIPVSITGMDRPGITTTVTNTLAEFTVNILDIGQTVIHDSLSLDMLVQIPSESVDTGKLEEAIQQKINELNLSERFVDISHESYENWVAQQGNPRHIVTLLARPITTHQISQLSGIVAGNGLKIDEFTHLS